MSKNRSDGSFYTPKIFADFAHSVISKHFGNDWKSRYIVWDSAWGLGNLTGGYRFDNLLASTIDGEDLLSPNNPEATKFRMDFLNDDIPDFIDEILSSNPPIIFFFNPPYASHSEMRHGVKLKKDFSTDTMVAGCMGKLGKARINLFAQFLYRVKMIKDHYKLTDCNICVFSSSIFMSGSGYGKFRREFLFDFNFIDGYLFNASYFDECSDRWGVSFSVWKSGNCQDKHNFLHHVLEVKNDNVEITGEKLIYNIDGETSLREWAKAPIANQKTYPGVTLKSAINVGEKVGSWKTEDAIGFYVNDGNNVYQSLKSCYILSACPNSRVSGFSITPNNFERVCVAFTARKVIQNNWMNDKDEFLAPGGYSGELEKIWNEFKADSIVYSIFHSASNQSSLRNIEWIGERHDIKNEMFPFLCEDVVFNGSYYGNKELVDSWDNRERFVAKYIIDNHIANYESPEAQAVFNIALGLTHDTIDKRKEYDELHPEYQINNCDAGYYQMRPLWEKYNEDALKEFRKAYKRLGEKLKRQVYQLGLLK